MRAQFEECCALAGMAGRPHSGRGGLPNPIWWRTCLVAVSRPILSSSLLPCASCQHNHALASPSCPASLAAEQAHVRRATHVLHAVRCIVLESTCLGLSTGPLPVPCHIPPPPPPPPPLPSPCVMCVPQVYLITELLTATIAAMHCVYSSGALPFVML